MIKYKDFAITAMFYNEVDPTRLEKMYSSEEERNAHIEGLQVYLERFYGYRIDYKESLAFINKRREVYTHLTPYEHLLNSVICDGKSKHGLYFPEHRHYMAEINPSLSEDEYQSAFQFWKDYQFHLKARTVIQSLADMIGVTEIQINDEKIAELNCIGFLGSPGNSIQVETIISFVKEFQEKTGNLLWVPPYIKYQVGDGHRGFLASPPEGDDLAEPYLLTLAGTIYPEGKPRIKSQFSSHLKTVK